MSFNYFGQLVIGPSGSGKSTYCSIIQKMAAALRRNVIVVNLDPAAEYLPYDCYISIQELITLDDAMKVTKLGPNGGLVYCLELLLQNIDWLEDKIGELLDEDYVLFDCPGQIELYSHLDTMTRLSESLRKLGFSLCSVCLLDVTFLNDDFKWVGGTLASLSFMMSLGLPHISVLSKCDLVTDKKWLKKKLKGDNWVDAEDLQKPEANSQTPTKVSAFDTKYQRLRTELEEVVS